MSQSNLLEQYLSCPHEQEEAVLSGLLFEVAEPVIWRVVRARLQRAPDHEREDVAADVMASLLARLKALKQEGASAFERLESYIAVAAQNGCDQYLRRLYPQRHRAKNRLRYLLSKTTALAMWEDAQGRTLCGLAVWSGRAPVACGTEILRDVDHARSDGNLPPAELALRIFRRAGGPMELDAAVSIFAHAWGMSDADAPLDGLDPGPQEHRSHDDVMHDRRMLARLWNEIESLPPPQRSALLLNLRDSGGGSALSLLPATGIASIRQIAAVLGIAVETFAGLWKRLPLDDLEIASLLGVPRQKVINMRLAARQRLARRTASKNAQAGTNR
jgi:RNA polymerase sigma factor (sigma-70 family)